MKVSMIEKAAKPLDEFIARKTEMLAYDSQGGIPIKISSSNFHELGLFSSGEEVIGIDGGHAEILSAPNFSLGFIKVVAVSYIGRKRKSLLNKEFFCLVTAEPILGKIRYKSEFYGDTMFDQCIYFDEIIDTVDGERYAIEVSSVLGMIRRYYELKLASEFLGKGNIVIDGSMKAKTKEEKELVDKLVSGNIGFLSKTSNILTKNASSMNATLNEAGPKSSWYYHPVFENSNMYLVKLNAKSKHVFKLELGKGCNVKEYILSLSLNSDDPVFYGYPYCLIEADKIARVTNKEKEYLRTVFLSKIKNKERLEYMMADLDAHDILDKIGY